MKARIKGDPKLAACLPTMASDLATRDVAYCTQTLGTPTVKHNGKTPVKTDAGENLLKNDGLEVAKRNLRLMVYQRDLLKNAASTVVRTNDIGSSLELKELSQSLLDERNGGRP